MNKPLSYIQYFKGNMKKVLSLIITIVFSIFLIGNIHMFLNNSIETGEMISYQYDYYTFVDTSGETIELNNKDLIDLVIRVKGDMVLFQGMAINSNVEILIMDREDIIYLVNLLDIEINRESIPQNNQKQLILNNKVINNNNFTMDTEVKNDPLMKLVKGFDSKYLMGFVPTSKEEINTFYTKKGLNQNNGYIIVPKAGKLTEMNLYLKTNLNRDFKIYDINYWDIVIESAMGDVDRLFNIITVIVLISIGIGLGISTYVHYFQRRKEFGLLSSIGYSDQKILLSISKEIVYTSILAFIISLLLLIIGKELINLILLIPEGIPVFRLDESLFSRIIVIPLFITVFSLIPTWILLKKIDSVSIIEGEI